MRSPKKYLHLYNTQAEQTADYYGSAYEEPWVSFEKQHETVTYNKKPRLVILTSASDSKTYDETMLTNDTITVSGEGFKEGDGADFNVTGYQILVGASENTFTYNLYDYTDASEYDIRTVFGTLEVVDGTGEGEEPVDPEFVVTMEADDDTYKLGDTVTFSITASNIYDSAETIYLQTIDGVTLAQTTFETMVGESVQTTATYAIIEPDILAGEFTASVTAYVGNVQAEADCTIVTESPNPSMVIRVNTLTEPPEGYFQLGDTIDYEVTVTNDGNLTLTDIQVSSSTNETMPKVNLAPGASETQQFSHEVTEEDVAAEEVNVAWTGRAYIRPLGTTIVADNRLLCPTEEPNPVLTIIPQTVSVPENGEYYTLGEEIQYQITVRNDGNLTLTNIEISSSDDSTTFDSLSPGSSQMRQFSHVVTEADILATGINVEWTGTADNPSTYPTSVENVSIQEQIEGPNPVMTISVSETSSPEDGIAYTLGETIDYEVTTTNDGNLTLFEIQASSTDGNISINTLAPGDSETRRFSHVVTEADVAAEGVNVVWSGAADNPSPETTAVESVSVEAPVQ